MLCTDSSHLRMYLMTRLHPSQHPWLGQSTHPVIGLTMTDEEGRPEMKYLDPPDLQPFVN